MSTDVVCLAAIKQPATEIEERILNAELRNLRRRGARNAAGEEYSQGRSCARCKTPLGRIYNTGASCPRCRHRVCRQCREYRGSNGTEWLCIVCHKIAEIQAVSGEWMNEASSVRRSGRRKFLTSLGDIPKRSIRRSWTINGPPASWCAVRGSPELRAYQSLPRHQDYFDVTRSSSIICTGIVEKEYESSESGGIGDRVEVQVHADSSLRIEEKKEKEDENAKDEKSDGNLVPIGETDFDKNKFESHNEAVKLNKSDENSGGSQRVSQIKPPRIHAKFNFSELVNKQTPPKSIERKSNIPILRRSSKEFEDIRSPIESVKRSLIPQRYRGSTDDLRRSREDITGPSQIPKLFSPRGVKEERLKRQDSKDEIRSGLKIPCLRKEEARNASQKTVVNKRSDDAATGREEIKSGIKVFRREGTGRITGREERRDNIVEESKTKFFKEKEEKEENEEEEEEEEEGNSNKKGEETMVEKREPETAKEETLNKGEKKFDRLAWGKLRSINDKDEENMKDTESEKKYNQCSDDSKEEVQDEIAEGSTTDKNQVVRRKFSKEEFSNTDDTDDVPNRRSSSHLSPEASPLSTRSSRYSPRESESEPTPALPRKTSESSGASQRVRDAITRTRRESNSSARYESSGSESIRLSGNVETRRVRFGGGGNGIEEVQRDSATSAGEDEPRNLSHNPVGQRDSRTAAGALQARAVRRRRQFETQGSRRRGRSSHARGCAGDELQHLQAGVVRGGGQLSPPQGQEQPIIEYRRLVFISSDSSSGREEDDADSSSGSSSLNGAPRTQGLEDCDWDYFESGGSVPAPLAHLQVGIVGSTTSLNSLTAPAPGFSTVNQNQRSQATGGRIHQESQDWSCCPGRGSSACQACGGSRGANVFPVPVPIPVPVPYPVPVPASLWTSSLGNNSMINCASGELGALQLARGGTTQLHPAAAQWFAWPQRFVNDVNAAAAGFVFQQSNGGRGGSTVDLERLNLRSENEARNENEVADDGGKEMMDNKEDGCDKPMEKRVEEEDEGGSSSSEAENEEELDKDSTEGSGSKKIYRLSQINSGGSSSGRSSADSSDLEDSASHRFSRVFIVNDDSSSASSSSSTSDNERDEDVEDIEDSDSNREVGITLRRVTALPEDGPVILRHVRFLDEDCGTSEIGSKFLGPQRLSGSPRRGPEAEEIYLVDSKEDEAERRVELRSIRSLDPDSLMPEEESCVSEASGIVPDSLEVVEIVDVNNGISDICDFVETTIPDKPGTSAVESDKKYDLKSGVTRQPVNDDNAASKSGIFDLSIPMSFSTSSSPSTKPESSDANTTTGSEISSDELHEYEIAANPWPRDENEDVDETAAFSAVNEDLLRAREIRLKPKNLGSTDAAGFVSDEFSTDDGSSSRLDSGVATGVEDAVSASVESIELVHSKNPRESGEENEKIGNRVTEVCQYDEKTVSTDDKERGDGDVIDTRNKEVAASVTGELYDRDNTVGDLISIKIQEIFKSSERLESRQISTTVGVGERLDSEQVGGGSELDSAAQVRTVERRPPAEKDGCDVEPAPATRKPEELAKGGQNLPGNRYKSLVMITQGAYQPVNVVTSDTTTLLQPEEGPSPPRGLAGYFHLALESAGDIPHRNGGAGPRRPLTVKRASPSQNRAVSLDPEVDSGLSVGSASESDDVLSVKSASRPPTVSDKNTTAVNGVVVILEEGLADDDSWVEEVSHDEEEEQGATTATEESSEDEGNNVGDREEELRGYHRQAIDFTLHTIVEESCEESEVEPSSIAIGSSPRKQRPPSASELEKYFFFGLGDGAGGLTGSREVDSLSETSSIYSEGLESLGQDEQSPGQGTERKNSPDYLNNSSSSSSSRLEKYFLSDFLGFDRDRRDSDGSVGSDSEGRPSPEQRRKRLVRARGTGRSHSSSLDNLLALTQSSANLSSQNSLQDLSLNPDSQETQSEGSSTETDGADDQTPAFGTDGQFDTVKRKKKKPRNVGTQSPRISDDRNKTPEPLMPEADGDLLDAANSEDDRSETPQPDGSGFSTTSQLADINRAKQTLLLTSDSPGRGKQQQQQQQSDVSRGGVGALQGGDAGLGRGKQHSRDSGFIGSCDDLLQHQRASGSDSQSSTGTQENGKKDPQHERRSGSTESKYKEGGNSSGPASAQANLPPPNASLSRKDSFNNWSSDEETNLMMSKMRQFFKTMVANSNNNGQTSANSSGASPAPSPRLPGNSPRSRAGSQNRTKPPQLVYFENELTRLMKTVPGIRDEQVKEIVEYLSSEDTWSDSYDSSDYTSSDLEGAGGRRSALQEQISQSCQQIISKFDTTGSAVEPPTPVATQPPQPLGCRDTAFVYQKLVQSFTKMTGDGVSSDASSTPHSSPPLIAKVMHHIGSRLVALMHEVSEAGPTAQPSSWRRYPHHRTPSSASTTEDDDSTSDSANTPVQHQLPRSKSHDPLLLLNGHPAAGYQEGEEREASDNERFSWRGSFESALMPADSRTKLSLLACSGDVSASASALAMAAKRRSAGDLLFNPKSLSREQLDRVRSCGSIGGGSGSIEDKIWSNRRRSSVPDANTRGESGTSAVDDDTEDELEYAGDSRATTLPRGLQAAATATNSLPRLPAGSPSPGGPVTMHKAHSVHHFLQQHNNVKSARYRPPGFARNNLAAGNPGGPKRAVSAPGLQLPASSTNAGKRENARSRRQAVSLTPDDGSSLSEACSTPIIGGVRAGNLSNEDVMDRDLHASLLGTRVSSSSLGARSDSMASVYSGAGEGRWGGSITVRGEVEFALQYGCKEKIFEVRVTKCRDLAPVDVKRNCSDPYVKVYLLPDKSKGGKRKTKVKKHTLNPVFGETLKFNMSINELENRTLWLTVWHSDMFGRNDFLGEVRMALKNKIFNDPTPRWYPLQERSEPFDDPAVTQKGEVIVGLKFVPPDPTQQQERSGERGSAEKLGSKSRKICWSKGALHVLVKEARNLQTRTKHGGTCDPFCKSYLLPDKGRSGKQKTGVVRRCTGRSPVWGHTFIYRDVSLQELAERGLELTVWDYDRIASNEFLGGVRFNLGTGKHYGSSVEWMDATGRELSLWQDMLERPNFWVEGVVPLRPNLH